MTFDVNSLDCNQHPKAFTEGAWNKALNRKKPDREYERRWMATLTAI